MTHRTSGDLSEEARLELLRITIRFAADNFNFNGKGIETARTLAECYSVLAEVLSGSTLPCKIGEVGHPSSRLLRNKWPFPLNGVKNGLVRLLKAFNPRARLLGFVNKSGQIDDQGHSINVFHDVSPSSAGDNVPAPDSISGRHAGSITAPALSLSLSDIEALTRDYMPEAIRKKARKALRDWITARPRPDPITTITGTNHVQKL